MKHLFICTFMFLCLCALAQQKHPDHHSMTRATIFPDVPGYLTLSTDLHIHTIFSDGLVWPSIRIAEAIKDSLDVVSLTDHIEYLPHRGDLPPKDRNRSYEEGIAAAEESDLIVVLGTELTRDLPPGHSNAIFLSDVNPFVLDDPMDQFLEAQRQGAFVFWNHPSWEGQQRSGIAALTEMHKELIEKNLLHGIEVVNGPMYSEHALQIALDNDLTIMGTSDIHGLIDWDHEVADGGHRPSTLVFATERSLDGLKEALFDRRTVVYYKDYLIGREEHLVPLVEAIVEVSDVHYQPYTALLKVTLTNNSSANMILVNRSAYGLHLDSDVVVLPHMDSVTITIQTEEVLESVDMAFEILSATIAPKTHPVVSWTFTPE